MLANILIIDDEQDIRNLLGRILKLEGYGVTMAENMSTGIKLLDKERYHAILCDVKLPDGNGVDMVPTFKKRLPNTEIILLTAFGTISDGVSSIKSGAFDYITKGDDNNKILPLISKAVEKSKLQYKIQDLEAQLNQPYRFDKIIGKSPLFLDAVSLAKRVSATDATVLLTGETGTGKEVFAQAIHAESPRAKKPFVAINCSAFSKDLLESELFGYKAGAFTGANKDKLGLVEEANGGTLFLDEMGEMDQNLQAKILRFLETNTFLKLGETKESKSDVRIIAATNRDLLKESEAGTFRSDLYYRLSVFSIRLPSLKERAVDIPLLAAYFNQMVATKMGKKPPLMTESFAKTLENMHWKGNIRELKNTIERAVILAVDDQLDTSALPILPIQDATGANSLLLADMEKQHIIKVLQITGNNKTKTAETLGIGLTTLYRKIDEYQIHI